MIGKDVIHIIQDNKLEDAHLSKIISYGDRGLCTKSISLFFKRFAQDTILIQTRIDIECDSGKFTRVDDVLGRL